MGLMGKNIVSDLVQGNYGGALLTTSIIASSPVLSKLSSYMATVGTTALKMTSPFVGKLTSAFVLYDLIKNIKFLINGRSQDRVVSAANIFADGTLLGVDAAEIGLNLAETFGVVEGLSDIFGPLGAGLGLLVFVGVDTFSAMRKVSQINQKIKLTAGEKFYEGVRAFFGSPPEQYIGHLLEEKEHYQNMFNATVKFLSENQFIRTYIFPAQTLIKGAWLDDQDNVISLAGKPYNQKVGRNRPDLPKDYKLVCFNTALDIEPVGFLESMFSMFVPGKYFTVAKKLTMTSDDQPGMMDENFNANCSRAVGLTNLLSTGDLTMIDMRDGTDIVEGTDQGRNIFRIGNGLKHKVKGGDKNDLFIFDGNETGGSFEGMSGDDTADFRNFAPNAKTLEFRSSSNGTVVVFYKKSNFEIILRDVENFIGRYNAPDLITPHCDAKFVDSNHGGIAGNDLIHIMEKICFYQLTVVVGHRLLIRNDAKFGNFDYMIEESACGIIFLDQNTLAQHRFIFRSGFDQLVLVSNVDIGPRSLVFHFGGETGLVIHNTPFSKCTFHFSDDTELIIDWSTNLHMHAYITSHKMWSKVEDFASYYDNMSKNHNCSITVYDQIKNFTLLIANPYESSASHIFHNNPYQTTMILGRDQENVYVVNYDLNFAQFPNVTIQDNGSTKNIKTIDMNDFSQLLNHSLEMIAMVESTDIVLQIKTRYQVLTSIILKNANRTFTSYHILFNRACFQITKANDSETMVLKPLPVTFSQDRDYIILSEDDIPLVNTSLAINKTVQEIMPVKFNDSLILYDMKNGDIAFFVILNNFYAYESSRLHTLILQFENQSLAVEKFFRTKAMDLDSKIKLEKIRKRKIHRNMIDDVVEKDRIR
uniref:Uncharacterized protein n=1 Tax=Romanomermis culicivorax TaxID=13658 RepID=A0A915IR30_ROMCU